MTIFLTIIHVLICLFIIGVVLLQSGKGAEIGASFGGGGSGSVFGAGGGGNVMTRITTGAAIIFMLTSLALAYFSGHSGGSSIMSSAPKAPVSQQMPIQQGAAPVVPAPQAPAAK